MQGLRILLVFGALAVAALTYLLWPGEEDVQRAFEVLTPHREDAELAMKESAELIQYLDRRKGTERKKIELGELRRRAETLGDQAVRLRDDPVAERKSRVRQLDDLEARFWELKRSAEDLRARLREMKTYHDDLAPVISRLGRLQRELVQAQEQSQDFTFRQRAAELIQKSKVSRDLADQGMVALSSSIVKGRQIAQAALHDLKEAAKLMQELLETLPEPAS